MLKKILQLIVVLLFTASGVMAQTVDIHEVTVSPGEISVQMDMNGFTDNIVAITYWIEFDSDLMDFVRIENEQLAGSWTANYSAVVDKLSIQYFASGSGSPINGKLLDIVFAYKGGFSSVIAFDEANCMITKAGLGEVSATYLPGSVTQLGSEGTISMAPLTEPIGNTVTMPVTIDGTEPFTGFSSVNAITLMIAYNPTQLDYAGLINPYMSGFVANAANGVLTVTWSGAAQNFANLQTLFELQFVYKGGNADVTFIPGCEIANATLILPVTYVDGSVDPAAATAELNISEVAGVTGNTVNVPIVASGWTGIQSGPVTLEINFDNSKLTYTGYSAQQLTGWVVNSNSNGHVSMQCSNGVGTAITDGALVTLNFIYLGGGQAVIEFAPGSEVKSVNLVTIPVTFNDGFVDIGYTVDGQLTYNGDGARKIFPATVYLRDQSTDLIVYTTTTDSNGDYEFTEVLAGSYYLDATTTIDGSQAYDISDAFDIAFIGSTLTGLQALAADVDQVGGIDITDAFHVANSCPTISPSYIKVSEWIAPEWIFENTNVFVVNSNITQNFGGICSGDANAVGFLW
ncbi:MAG: hypothetical protein A2W85_01795 [Bacteroidetes bacterium GWF2_41_31]|nr:MAG: hypothetical protein A2W85_01795 [Bacteroidetes bacterium GWF2_41_31]